MPGEVMVPGAVETVREPEATGRLPTESEPAAASLSSRGTGRIRHEEKITVYISRDELVRLEQARLVLRAEHGLAVDRGRIVREAVAAALDEFDVRGAEATLLQRLAGS